MNYNKERTWMEINLDNFQNNLRIIKNHIGNNTKMLAVVKADAYGHGAGRIALESQKFGVDYFAVACIEEAKQLRNAGIIKPILILSHISGENADDIIKYDIEPSVFNTDIPDILNERAKEKNKVIKVHIKLDTGMTRLGFSSDNLEKTLSDIRYIASLSNIKIEGIFTHFADAENKDPFYTDLQFKKYQNVIKILNENNIIIPIKHVCNSAGSILKKDMYMDMVRCGIIIYGYYPDGYLKNNLPGIKPIMSLKSRILQIRELDDDITIGYGRTYNGKKSMKIGVVSIGYADGYLRELSNKFYVLVNGKKAPIVGRICMDQMMIDLSSISDVKEGDLVTVIGKNGDLEITADDIAKCAGTISYEILCLLGNRLPRIYVEHNKQIDCLNYME